MGEGGLGVSIVPLMPNGAVTQGHRVRVRSLGESIRPIHSGILVRRGERLSAASRAFLRFLKPGEQRARGEETEHAV